MRKKVIFIDEASKACLIYLPYFAVAALTASKMAL